LRYVAVPHAIPYLLTAARLAAPRALLGVMIAEYLATGTGLGNLLNDSRGRMEYGMIWTVSAVAVLVAVIITAAVGMAERWVWRRHSVSGRARSSEALTTVIAGHSPTARPAALTPPPTSAPPQGEPACPTGAPTKSSSS
jgi:hypothetical protein